MRTGRLGNLAESFCSSVAPSGLSRRMWLLSRFRLVNRRELSLILPVGSYFKSTLEARSLPVTVFLEWL